MLMLIYTATLTAAGGCFVFLDDYISRLEWCEFEESLSGSYISII